MTATAKPLPEDALRRIRESVGPKGWTADPLEMEPYLIDERRMFHGRSPMIVRPATVEQVAAVVRLCAGAGIPIVPQGGNTSMCGGSVPAQAGDEILLSLSRLNRIREVDALNYTITVEAGCVLANIQHAAAEVDRLFPLSLAAEGSCQIGGNLSTNAGGVTVLHYGNARDLVLGLEVVLPDGRIWDGLRGLRKDNTGYDLKQLFIGAEGTLGIITAAVLKLFPRPQEVVTAMASVSDLEGVIELLARIRTASGDSVTGFELMEREPFELVLRLGPNTVDPFDRRHEHYALIEVSSGNTAGSARDALESVLAGALEEALVIDAVIAESQAQAEQLWHLREVIGDAQKLEGGGIKHDVSVPVSRIPEFVRAATLRCREELADIRVYAFGHVGDGNVHFNLAWPEGADRESFLERWPQFNRIVHDVAASMGGSFSAEHGIGQLKRGELARYAPAVEIELMKRVKAAFDPDGIMNPGKVI